MLFVLPDGVSIGRLLLDFKIIDDIIFNLGDKALIVTIEDCVLGTPEGSKLIASYIVQLQVPSRIHVYTMYVHTSVIR